MTRKEKEQRAEDQKKAVAEVAKLSPAQLKAAVQITFIQSVATGASSLFKWSSIAVIAWAGMRVGVALAGQTTVVDFVAKWNIGTKASYLVALGAVIFAWLERLTKRRIVKRYATRIQDLERRLNPDRGTSNLDQSGTTRREDDHE